MKLQAEVPRELEDRQILGHHDHHENPVFRADHRNELDFEVDEEIEVRGEN